MLKYSNACEWVLLLHAISSISEILFNIKISLKLIKPNRNSLYVKKQCVYKFPDILFAYNYLRIPLYIWI